MWIVLIGLVIFFYAVYANIKRVLNSNKNLYIENHKKKIKDDKLYNDYLKFCQQQGELPVSKKGFLEHRVIDNEFLNTVNKYIK